jgi:hypothetical protein
MIGERFHQRSWPPPTVRLGEVRAGPSARWHQLKHPLANLREGAENEAINVCPQPA